MTAVRDAVAWALWAGEDATYVEGEHVPDAQELTLTDVFLEALRSRDLVVVSLDGLREIAGAAGANCYSWDDSARVLGIDVGLLA